MILNVFFETLGNFRSQVPTDDDIPNNFDLDVFILWPKASFIMFRYRLPTVDALQNNPRISSQ